jgi:hypothetical protein
MKDEALKLALEAWACTGKDMPVETILQRGDDLANAIREAIEAKLKEKNNG